MTLYSIPASSPYQWAFRCMAVSAILLLLGALIVSLWPPINMTDRTLAILGCLAGALVLVSIVGAYRLGIRENLWKANRNCSWELTDSELIQRRPDSPMIEIPVDQITTIVQNRGRWLFIEGGEPRRRIVVPGFVIGMEELRRELSANREVAALKTGPRSFLIPGLFLVASCFLLLSHSRAIVLVAGSIAVLTDASMLYEWCQHTKSVPRGKMVTISWIATLLILAFVVFLRALRPL